MAAAIIAESEHFVVLLKACAKQKDLQKGARLHAHILSRGLLDKSCNLGSSLINMYAKCGALAKAATVLDQVPIRNVVTWNALITGYVQLGQFGEALRSLERMKSHGFHPNAVTFACILKACGNIGALEQGELIHDEILQRGLLSKDIVLGTNLVDMYAKCGALVKAIRVLEELPLRDVISWSALIAGCTQLEQAEEALAYFVQMQWEGIFPNSVTFSCVLKACGNLKALEMGTQIHREISRLQLLNKDAVLCTTLADMYAKCGALEQAARMLNELHVRDVVSWSALIRAYVDQGQGEEAFKCFELMQGEGLSPDTVTFICILQACSCTGAADKGTKVHDLIIEQGLVGKDIMLENTLIDMYAKFGALSKAERVLEELAVRNIVTWNALIAGYAEQAQGEEALNCFERLQCEGLAPDGVTLASVLTACGRSKMLEDAHRCFVKCNIIFGIRPGLEHHTCMIDLFSRAGELEKALDVIKKMPFSDHGPVWHAIMGACQEFGNVKLGTLAFDIALQIDQSDSLAYMLMAKVYAATGLEAEGK